MNILIKFDELHDTVQLNQVICNNKYNYYISEKGKDLLKKIDISSCQQIDLLEEDTKIDITLHLNNEGTHSSISSDYKNEKTSITVIYQVNNKKNSNSWKSLLEQNIGFNNIQLIIIDKGFSHEIMENTQIFNNIDYHYFCKNTNKFKNSQIRSDYYTFLCDGDQYTKEALKNALNFLKASKSITAGVFVNTVGKDLDNYKYNGYPFTDTYQIMNYGNSDAIIPLSFKGVIFRNKKSDVISNHRELLLSIKDEDKFVFFGKQEGIYVDSVIDSVYSDIKELEGITEEKKYNNRLNDFVNAFIDREYLKETKKIQKETKNLSLYKNIKHFYPYYFSIIMAVYNTEEFISESIESILHQTIDSEYVEIILINDESTDNSSKICEQYAEKYPHNITLINKKNGGVSSARNLGIKKARGKILNFLDSDDLLTPLTLKNVFEFMKKNSKVDVSSIGLEFFDAKTGEHPLNYKFDPYLNRICDLRIEYKNIQANISSAFIRREAIGDLRLDENLKYGEDGKFVHQILMNNPYIGLMNKSENLYMYRRRNNGTSAIQTNRTNKSWYIDTLKHYHKVILEKKEKSTAYSKYLVMYDFQWRLKVNPRDYDVLSEEEIIEYKKLILTLLSYIDDEFIYEENLLSLSPIYRAALLRKNVRYEYRISGVNLFLGTNKVTTKSQVTPCISVAELKNDTLHLLIKVPDFEINAFGLSVAADEKILEPYQQYYGNAQYFIDEPLIGTTYLEYFIPLNSINKIEIKNKFQFSGKRMKLTQGKFFNFSNTQNSYAKSNDYGILFDGVCEFSITKLSKVNSMNRSRNFKLFRDTSTRNIAGYRILGDLVKRRDKHKKVWLISDRIDSANDNGEALFRYIMSNPIPRVETFFVISDSSDDYKRLKKEFNKNIIAFGSKEHKLKMFVCDKLIAAHVDDIWIKPFSTRNDNYRDMFHFDTIFLQHGVTTENLSGWLKKEHKNLARFCTASLAEQDSIVNKFDYSYSYENVPITGMARHDRLEKKDDNYITIMPTWRPILAGSGDNVFTKSKYFQFFNNLIHNEQLLESLHSKNIILKFVQHPNMRKYNHLFTDLSECIEIVENMEYKDIISSSRLLITDRSSVFFDFAYLNKPIIHTFFDFDELMDQAAYSKGYFDYEKDGFGKVTYTVDETLKQIMSYLENDFLVEQKYKENISKFFLYQDKNNCKRVIENILEMDRHK